MNFGKHEDFQIQEEFVIQGNRRLSPWIALVAVLVFCLGMAYSGFAQGGSGQLTGLVTDPAGAAVPKVAVTLTNNSTGEKRDTVTTDAGIYRFPDLPVVGTYTLRVQAKNFKTFEAGNIVITVGRTVNMDVRLELGATSEVVQVEAGVQLVQSTESQVGGVLNQRDWQSLPLETRSQNEFINTLAGVVPSDFAGTGRGAAVDGARTGTGNFLVEGYDNNDQGLGGGGSLVGPGGANTTISPDAIQEYRVIEHLPPAEYGKTGGFVTDTVLKSGTDHFHGSLFEYNRVQALAANSFFSNAAGLKDSLVRNQFGGSIGGPIIRNKTFFFFTTEFHRVRQGGPVTTTSTTQDFLDFVNSGQFEQFMESDPNGLCMQYNGVACPGAFSQNATLGPIFSNLKATEPFPLATRNFSNIGAGLYTGGFIYPVNVYGDVTVTDPSQTNQARYSVKIDHKLSNVDQLDGSFLYDNADFKDATSGSDTTLGVPLLNHGRAMNAGITWTHTFSPTVLNQGRISYVRHTGNFPGDPNAAAAGLPSIVTAFDPLGVGFGNASNLPQFFTENEFGYRDDLSFTKGKHSFKAGVTYDRTRNGSSFEADYNGLFLPYGVEDLVTDMTFSDLADQAVFGGPTYGSWYYAEASVDPTTGQRPNYYRGYRANEVAAYFQDDWRVSKTLTFNLGLRWDYFGPPHNYIPNIDSDFYFGTPVTPVPTATNNPFFPTNSPLYAQVATGEFQVRNSGIWNKDTNNWGPRLGFAWDTAGNQKLVVRGGYGIGYDRMYNNIFENIRFNPPYFCFCDFGTYVNGVPGGGIETPGIYTVPFTSTGAFVDPNVLPSLPLSSPRHMDQNLVTPYYEQATLGLQWEFKQGWVMEANYIGTFGKKLIGIVNINTFDGRTVGNGYSSKRPNPNISNDNFRTNAFASNYSGLQVSLRKRFSGGLQFNASYTYSKAIDTLSDTFSGKQGTNPTDNMNINEDRGPADFDLRHRFVGTIVYDLPFAKNNRWIGGWAVSGIVSLQSGTPFSVYDSNYDTNHDGLYEDRVSYTGSGAMSNAVLGKGSPADGYLNAADFADTVCPASVNMGLWCDGGSGRNALTGPGYKNLDFGVTKRFRITESTSISFLANFFNLFNHTNFTNPDNNISDGAFGQSRGTLSPRVTQLALRFDF
jgi:Carboxypeptidase regulatory-like domain/TonB dependent receptor-like, beta-barrel